MKARLWRVRLQLRERLNRYFDERSRFSARRASSDRQGDEKIVGLFAECLRDSIAGHIRLVALDNKVLPARHIARAF